MGRRESLVAYFSCSFSAIAFVFATFLLFLYLSEASKKTLKCGPRVNLVTSHTKSPRESRFKKRKSNKTKGQIIQILFKNKLILLLVLQKIKSHRKQKAYVHYTQLCGRWMNMNKLRLVLRLLLLFCTRSSFMRLG